jgi:hypothetical protein
MTTSQVRVRHVFILTADRRTDLVGRPVLHVHTTISMTPWGKYQYKRLLMGVETSPDIFQRIMYELLGDIPNIQVYLDDILITSNGTFEEHAAIMAQVLDRLQKANFRANL